jgi:hypothetical protein
MSAPNGTTTPMTTPKEIFPLDKTDPTTKSMKENEFPVEHTLEIMRHVSVVTKGRKEYGWRYWKVPEDSAPFADLSGEARKAYNTKPDAPTLRYKDAYAVWVKDGPPEGDPFEDDKEEMEPERKTVSEWAQQEPESLKGTVTTPATFVQELPKPVAPHIARPDFTFEHLSYLARELYRVSRATNSTEESDYLLEASNILHATAIRAMRAEIDSKK